MVAEPCRGIMRHATYRALLRPQPSTLPLPPPPSPLPLSRRNVSFFSTKARSAIPGGTQQLPQSRVTKVPSSARNSTNVVQSASHCLGRGKRGASTVVWYITRDAPSNSATRHAVYHHLCGSRDDSGSPRVREAHRTNVRSRRSCGGSHRHREY